MKKPVMVDMRNIYQLDEMKVAGFEYHSIGRTSLGKPKAKPTKVESAA